MWKIIKEEFKYLTKTKWKIFALILLIFVPAVYACSFLSAFNTPMKGMNNANIMIVNFDSNSNSKDFTKKVAKEHTLKTLTDKSTFKMNIKSDLHSLYKTPEDARQAVKDGKLDAVFIVPEGFGTSLYNSLNNKGKMQSIEFYTSYKNNYLSAELLEMRSGLISLRKEIFQDALEVFATNYASKIKKFIDIVSIVPYEKILNVTSIGKDVRDYGQGMFPYFFSIGLWAGCVMMVFTYKNHRPGKEAQAKGAIPNYLARTCFWVGTGWIQTFIMVGLAFAVGLRIENVGSLLAYTLFVSLLFSLIVQSIAFFFRMGELGSFFVLILLITQLVAASATFPVELQNAVFQKIHPLLPFTYTVESFREFLDKPTFAKVMSNQWPILIYLFIVPVSIGWNIFISHWRKKHHGHFVSHEKEFHDE